MRTHSRTRPIHKNCRECGTNQRKLGTNPRAVNSELELAEPIVQKGAIRAPSHRSRAKIKEPKEYSDYLRSEAWNDTKKETIRLRGRECEACGSKALTLNVHHAIYERVGDERVTDLRILCYVCHGDLHKRYKKLDRFDRSYKNLWRFTDEYIAKRRNKPEEEPDNLIRSGKLLIPIYKINKSTHRNRLVIFKKETQHEERLEHSITCLCKSCTKIRHLLRTKRIQLSNRGIVINGKKKKSGKWNIGKQPSSKAFCNPLSHKLL